jgi:hypothetical protein
MEIAVKRREEEFQKVGMPKDRELIGRVWEIDQPDRRWPTESLRRRDQLECDLPRYCVNRLSTKSRNLPPVRLVDFGADIPSHRKR